MTLITEQRHENDCAIASLAMFLGREYEEVYVRAKFEFHSIPPYRTLTIRDTLKLAKSFGVKLYFKFGIPRNKAILIVSYDFTDTKHAVYFDGTNAIDPFPTIEATTQDYKKKTYGYLRKPILVLF